MYIRLDVICAVCRFKIRVICLQYAYVYDENVNIYV